ncbi:MAG TPA: ribosome assembly cofactor RimP [Bacteroides sp.]|jgi:ribosome maturation factor RimP|nr:ribosome assembly cofactor RimP [Bacteroides sp.]
MIEKGNIEAHLSEILAGTGIFLVDVKVDNNKRILVHVDRKEGISIDDCVKVSRALEARLDREQEDFALEVSSPGLDAPLKVPQQYEKSIGKMVSVQFEDNSKILGILKETDEAGILVEIASGKKGVDPEKQKHLFEEIKSTRIHIQF